MVDVESSRLVSAKNPAKWARVLACSSRLLDESKIGGGAPPVQIVLAGGERYDITTATMEEPRPRSPSSSDDP
jgi:hypothetical protein